MGTSLPSFWLCAAGTLIHVPGVLCETSPVSPAGVWLDCSAAGERAGPWGFGKVVPGGFLPSGRQASRGGPSDQNPTELPAWYILCSAAVVCLTVLIRSLLIA